MLNPQAGICPQCQQSNSPDAHSCSRCGMPLAASSAPPPAPPGAPAGFSTPFGTIHPPADPGASTGHAAPFGREGEAGAQPGIPPAFGAPATPPPAGPAGFGEPDCMPPGAIGPIGAVAPGGFGSPMPGDGRDAAYGAPGVAPFGMAAGGPPGQPQGAGPSDPGFFPPPGAQPSPPAHYGPMSGPGLPPGMGQNPGFHPPGVPQQPWYPQGAPPAMKNNRVTIAIVAILVGWLGIHKFMLGQTTAGIIMLVLSLFTCGMVPSVIGLVEGIIYFTKSDAEFYQTYEVERKAWF